MSQWPPSPIVEDESTALAREVVPNTSSELLKSDDQPAASRGSVNQYPIIVDSDKERPTQKAAAPVPPPQLSTDGQSSDDSTGPTTPPPFAKRDVKRQQSTGRSQENDSHPAQTQQRLVSTAVPVERASSRGRPQVTRIQTDVGEDVRAMATGSRRPPSPYSYNRTQSVDQVPSASTHAADHYLNPTYMTASPIEATQHKNMSQQSRRANETNDSSKSKPSEQAMPRSKSTRRDAPPIDRSSPKLKATESFHQPETRTTYRPTMPDTRASAHINIDRRQRETADFTPPRSRPSSKEGYHQPSEQNRPDSRRASHVPVDPRRTQESPFVSPYTSSAEEAGKTRHHRTNKEQDIEHRPSRRRSSHRKERPHLDTFVEGPLSSKIRGPAVHDTSTSSRMPAQQTRVDSTVPLPADAKLMEDYFERALRDNDKRRSHNTYAPRLSGSALASPMTSPPRTPRSERHNTDYFDLAPTTQTPVTRSRPPSMDEGQVKDLRSHSTLLSAATAGAAMAARGSNVSTENSSGASNSYQSSANRSRKPSPVYEDPRPLSRSGSYTYPDEIQARRNHGIPSYDERPSSRGNAHAPEDNWPAQHAPQRAMSYTAPQQGHSWAAAHVGPAFDHAHGTNVPIKGPPAAVPNTSIRYPVHTHSVPRPPSPILTLPQCPRSQPSVGYHDWYSIKEMSNLDICPTCMSVLGKTRFRDVFVPSLPRPYNEPSVCALSKPWIRVAFMQAIKQQKTSLDLVRGVSTLPQGTRPCAGNKLDLRVWFDIVDPTTRQAVPDFVACSDCIRKVDLVFPELKAVFDRRQGKLNQERICRLNTNSKHFASVIDHLEQTASNCKERRWRSADLQPLADHLRRVCRYRECTRDKPIVNGSWHFMSDLPEFTVCEECYEDVVWPLSNQSLARDMSQTTKLVPLQKNSSSASGISCQLYSDRMRRVFRDAVSNRNFKQLADVARTRQGAQQRIQEMNKLYEQDQRAGINRKADIERNNTIWRTLE